MVLQPVHCTEVTRRELRLLTTKIETEFRSLTLLIHIRLSLL